LKGQVAPEPVHDRLRAGPQSTAVVQKIGLGQ
jgi:hypothetical protein